MALPVALQTERIARVILHSLPNFCQRKMCTECAVGWYKKAFLLWTRPMGDPDSVASVIRMRKPDSQYVPDKEKKL
jgi:hypothetical protein